jgi:hypothetical protein
MANGTEVLQMLCPAGGWIIIEDDFNSITWVDERPRCTEEEFEAGFAQVDAFKAEQDAIKAATKAALLARLGITEEEAQLLIGGSN